MRRESPHLGVAGTILPSVTIVRNATDAVRHAVSQRVSRRLWLDVPAGSVREAVEDMIVRRYSGR